MKLSERFPTWADYTAHRANAARLAGILEAVLIKAIALTPQELAEIPGYPGTDAGEAKPYAKMIGKITVHNLLSTPGILLDPARCYIGVSNKQQNLSGSPLAAAKTLKESSSDRERERVCNEDIRRLIRILEVQDGPAWKEIKRLALKIRKGEHVKLMCYCAPRRCHGDAIAIVVQRLADRTRVSDIIAELQALLPAVQPSLV